MRKSYYIRRHVGQRNYHKKYNIVHCVLCLMMHNRNQVVMAGELSIWNVFCENLGHYWRLYNGTALNMAEDEVLRAIFVEAALRQQQYLVTW